MNVLSFGEHFPYYRKIVGIFIRWNGNVYKPISWNSSSSVKTKAGKEQKQLSLHQVKQHKGSALSQQIATVLSEKEQIAND